MASFDYNEMHKQLSRVKVFEKIDELDVIDPNDEATFGPVGAHKKKLFGENGWLEATGDSKGLRPCKSTSKKLKNLGKKIKQHVEELVSFLFANRGFWLISHMPWFRRKMSRAPTQALS